MVLEFMDVGSLRDFIKIVKIVNKDYYPYLDEKIIATITY